MIIMITAIIMDTSIEIIPKTLKLLEINIDKLNFLYMSFN